MTATFAAYVKMELEHTPGTNRSAVQVVKFTLLPGPEVDKSAYLGANDQPTEDGVRILAALFTHGVLANLHYAHQNGLWDSAEHVRKVLKMIETGFVHQVESYTDMDTVEVPK